ncbi:hypothetical protein PtA15_3A90 [Puccinia triticina]|nr:uncharacterized protein PtA15_3A90 [Puccinia triticina]WAQ82726.1 hypothetical protein PtA15_3A90 [Puccinia triticina]
MHDQQIITGSVSTHHIPSLGYPLRPAHPHLRRPSPRACLPQTSRASPPNHHRIQQQDHQDLEPAHRSVYEHPPRALRGRPPPRLLLPPQPARLRLAWDFVDLSKFNHAMGWYLNPPPSRPKCSPPQVEWCID